jgi:hypothetical protein
VIFTESLGCTMAQSWSRTHDKITAVEIWADVFQVVFGLLLSQHTLRLVFNNLSVDSLRCRAQAIDEASPNGPFLAYLWNRKHFRVPTFGKVWKFVDMEHATPHLLKKNVSLSTPDAYVNQRDLKTFANSAIPLVNRLVDNTDPDKLGLLTLLESWASSQRESVELCVYKDQYAPLCSCDATNSAHPLLQSHNFAAFECDMAVTCGADIVYTFFENDAEENTHRQQVASLSRTLQCKPNYSHQ